MTAESPWSLTSLYSSTGGEDAPQEANPIFDMLFYFLVELVQSLHAYITLTTLVLAPLFLTAL